MNLFLFDKDLRDSTLDFISFGHIWEDGAEHKLISELFDGEKSAYYLFNFVKIWETKHKSLEV